MPELLAAMDAKIKETKQDKASIGLVVADWVEKLRTALELPEMLPVYELGADMHTRIDPVEEARAMVGDGRVLTVEHDGPL